VLRRPAKGSKVADKVVDSLGWAGRVLCAAASPQTTSAVAAKVFARTFLGMPAHLWWKIGAMAGDLLQSRTIWHRIEYAITDRASTRSREIRMNESGKSRL
jgi:hypothetical protein